MTWNRSEVLALAEQHCSACHGLGLRNTWGGRSEPCKCVLRRIFRACHRRFRRSVEHGQAKIIRTTTQIMDVGQARTAGGPKVYGYKDREFAADFCLVAKRTLTAAQYKIFNWHYVLGADYRAINRKLGREREDRNTFHDFYRIEEKLGRVFRELQPYALFPLDEYFGGTVRGRKCHPIFAVEFPEETPVTAPLRFPLAEAAA